MAWKLGRKLAVGVLGVVVSGGGWYVANHVRQEHYRKITIGRDTTYVSGPKLADGRIDFLSAVNGEVSKGVTPENNAAVLLYRAIDPEDLYRGWMLEAFRNRLGVENVPEERVGYVDFVSFMQARQGGAAAQAQEAGREEEARLRDWDDRARKRAREPWNASDDADVMAWLERNREVLDLVMQASRRERCYFPLIGRVDLGTTMFATIGPLGAVRHLANLLATRGMLAVGMGDFATWRQCVMAQRRLGVLLSQGSDRITGVVALALISGADDVIASGIGMLTAAQAREVLAELRAMPRAVDMMDRMDRYERLDTIGEIANMAYFGSAAEDVSTDPADPLPAPKSLGFQPPIYFDELLREHNRLVGRVVASGRLGTYSQRRAAFEVIKGECSAVRAGLTGTSTTVAIRSMIYAEGAEPGRGSVLQDAMLEKARLTQLGLLLVAYRAEHGGYPKSLGELDGVEEAAWDLFADERAVVYVPGDGLVYSVGPNQKDDKGIYDRPKDKRPLEIMLRGGASREREFPDDIAVRLP